MSANAAPRTFENEVCGMRLTAEALASPELREQCPKGTGQIYWWRPLFPTDSNGYIGRNETTLWKRIQGHKTPNSECPGLRNAIAAHGLDGFDLVVLQANIPKSELATAEMRWIATYDTHQRGYNCTPGGEAPPMSVPEIVAKSMATKNTPASRAKTVAASRRHWDTSARAQSHKESLRASLAKSKVVRLQALRDKMLQKREEKMSAMTEHEKQQYLRKVAKGVRDQAKITEIVNAIRKLPGHENFSRKDVAKARASGLVARALES